MTNEAVPLDFLDNPHARHLARRLGSTWSTCTVSDLEARAAALTDGDLAACLGAAAGLSPGELDALVRAPVFWRLLDRVAQRTGRAPATLKAFLLLGLPVRWPWWRPTRPVKRARKRGRGRPSSNDGIPADPRRRPGSRRGLVLPPTLRRSLPLAFADAGPGLLVVDRRTGAREPVTLEGLDVEEVVALALFAQTR